MVNVINNLELIKPLLKFDSSDTYYHLQILKRKKDCEEHEKARNNNARCLKTYYISSIEYLELRFSEIQKLCKNHNARAYINLNAKSFIKTGFQLNLLIADRMKNNQFEYMYRSYESVAGMSDVNIDEKRWIVDIDEKEILPSMLSHIEYDCDPKSTFEGDFLGFYTHFNSKLISYIPTKSGWHIITKPFNVKQFKDKYPEVDIQKNNPTLLYFEWE